MSPDARRSASLIALSTWCALLLALRIDRSGSLRYLFLAWNLALAWIPYPAARAFRAAARRRRSAISQTAWFALWLTFLPNAPYLVTDLLHLRPKPPIPLWYDLALLASCAGTGLLLGYASLFEVHAAITERRGRTAGWGVAIASLFLSGFGIYLGRFRRWNSWHAFTEPAGLWRDIVERLLDRAAHPHPATVTIVLGGALILGYLTLHALAPRTGGGPSTPGGGRMR